MRLRRGKSITARYWYWDLARLLGRPPAPGPAPGCKVVHQITRYPRRRDAGGRVWEGEAVALVQGQTSFSWVIVSCRHVVPADRVSLPQRRLSAARDRRRRVAAGGSLVERRSESLPVADL